jgi:hypothetical protein
VQAPTVMFRCSSSSVGPAHVGTHKGEGVPSPTPVEGGTSPSPHASGVDVRGQDARGCSFKDPPDSVHARYPAPAPWHWPAYVASGRARKGSWFLQPHVPPPPHILPPRHEMLQEVSL